MVGRDRHLVVPPIVRFEVVHRRDDDLIPRHFLFQESFHVLSVGLGILDHALDFGGSIRSICLADADQPLENLVIVVRSFVRDISAAEAFWRTFSRATVTFSSWSCTWAAVGS